MTHGDATRAGMELARPATPGPLLPRPLSGFYCRTCGGSRGCWAGCPGGERVASPSWLNEHAYAKLASENSERRAAQTVPGVLEQIGPAHD